MEKVMIKLSCRERLKRTFKYEPTDRMPIRLWGVDPMIPSGREDWKPLYEMVEKYELDIFREWGPSAEEKDQPVVKSHSEKRESEKPDLWEIETTMETPAGKLKQLFYQPKDGSPGYVKKHFIETVEDAKKWLSIPFIKTNVCVDSYFELERKTEQRALLMISLAEPMYTVQALIGSELFGFWLMDERDLIHEMIDKAYKQTEDIVKHWLGYGIGDAYGWAGPELCIPPLASPRDFKEFVFEYDRRIIEIIHNANKLVWVHCHGDMKPVLESFIEMGVDCLNPIEPPPVGKLTLAQAKKICMNRMALEGGVEGGLFDLAQPGEMIPVVEDVVNQLKLGGGYILCPTASPNTRPVLKEKHIAHYRDFVETGLRLSKYD